MLCIVVFTLCRVVLYIIWDRFIYKWVECIYHIGANKQSNQGFGRSGIGNNMTTETSDFMRSHVIIGSVPTIEEQPTEQPKETIMTTIENEPKTEAQTTEQTVYDAIVTMACGRGSRIASQIETIRELRDAGLIHKSEHAAYNLARNISKRLSIVKDDDIDDVCDIIVSRASEIAFSIIEAKPTKKASSGKGGVLHSETVSYAVRLLNGGLVRSSRVADAFERVALRMLVCGDIDLENIPEALDKELNKAYTAIRAQGTKNAVELGGKSNTTTKAATKEAILKAIKIMKETDSYEYDILIGEAQRS